VAGHGLAWRGMAGRGMAGAFIAGWRLDQTSRQTPAKVEKDALKCRIFSHQEELVMRERWRAIVGFEGLYEVSDRGRVRSLDREYPQLSRWGTIYIKKQKGKILRPGVASNGYWTVALGRGKTRTVHSLVAEAFIGPRPNGCEVRHKNDIRTDSRLCNLEYGTRTDNIYDSIRNGGWFSEKRQMHLYGGIRKHAA